MKFDKALAAYSDYEPFTDKVHRYGDEVEVEDYEMTDEMVTEIRKAAEKAGDKKTVRMLDAIMAARGGDFDKSIPSLGAAPEIFKAYFRANLKDGWLYRRGADGHLHAWLVTGVKFQQGRDRGPDQLHVHLVANGQSGETRRKQAGMSNHTMTWEASQITRKKVSDILTEADAYIETDDLRADYDEALEHYTEVMVDGFAEQFRLKGIPVSVEGYGYKTPSKRSGHKVIHDLSPDEVAAPARFAESVLFAVVRDTVDHEGKPRRKASKDVDEDEEGYGPVPIHTVLRVFDLHTHDYLWVNSRDLKRYVYDKTLEQKIILPEDQRNLLEVLTTDLDDFTGDIIEGKTIGNVVLCKGMPGVGKTLSAEVYAEIIERPLYSIHSGTLGITAKDVRENLEKVFEQAQRWKCVLLLDEADVFVLERGNNLSQNAIVAEFLRTLEYFDGLMFMTTNRGEGIDDAILSRAAAIIDYGLPSMEAIAEIWKVQAANQGYEMDDSLLGVLVHGFEHITGRDVKMLLRLCLRVAKKRNDGVITSDIVASCSMFRGLHFKPSSRVA